MSSPLTRSTISSSNPPLSPASPRTQHAVAREDDFDFDSAEYRDLYARSAATAFQHPVWLRTLYAELAPRLSAQKRVLTIRDGDGRLVAVLPLVLRRRFGLRVLEYADLGVNDYAAPVIDIEAEPVLLADNDLGRRLRSALGRYDLLRIERVARAEDRFAALLGGARIKQHHYGTHPIDLPATAAAWRDSLRPDFVRHLERKYKRLRPKGGHKIRTVTDPAEVDDLMEQLRSFRADRFGERGGIDLMQQPDYFAFYRAVARSQDADRPHRLTVLEVGDSVAAVAFDLDDGDRELFLLVGYDVGRLRNYSLGLLIVDQLLQQAIERGRTCFDLTVGDESYKSDFGSTLQPLYELRLFGTPAGAIGSAGHDGYLRLRQSAKRIRDSWQRWRREREARSR